MTIRDLIENPGKLLDPLALTAGSRGAKAGKIGLVLSIALGVLTAGVPHGIYALSSSLKERCTSLESDPSKGPGQNRGAPVLSSQEDRPLIGNPKVFFHGINFAIWKIPTILEHGILSKSEAMARNVVLGFNYGRYGEAACNGDNGVSLACSPNGQCDRAFEWYIEKGISFAIEGIATRPGDSGIVGEVLASGRVPPEKIFGLVVHDELLEKKLTDVDFMDGGEQGNFQCRCQSLYTYVKERFGIEDSTILAKIEDPLLQDDLSQHEDLQDRDTKKQLHDLKRELNGLMLRGISAQFPEHLVMTIQQYLMLTLPPNMKIFNSRGVEISRDLIPPLGEVVHSA